MQGTWHGAGHRAGARPTFVGRTLTMFGASLMKWLSEQVNEIHHAFMNSCYVCRSVLYASNDAEKIGRKDRHSTRRASGHSGAAAGWSLAASTQPAGLAEPLSEKR